MNGDIGKPAEHKIQEWLDRPSEGYCFDRIPDQMTGFYGSKNICDFILYKYPKLYYIESKATWNDRFDFSAITSTQYAGLLNKSSIPFVYGLIVLLYASYKRCFFIDIRSIKELKDSGKASINIKKIDKLNLMYSEIATLPNNRKKLLDYTGEIEDYITWE